MIPDTWYLSKLYQLIGRRPRSVKEIHDWLKKRKAETEQIERLTKRLFEMKLLDDEAYTHAFVRTQLLLKPISTRQLIYKLQKKGINKDLTKKVLSEEGHDETNAAKEELERNSWRWKKFEGFEKKQKTLSFLVRKGFSLDLAKKVLNELEE